MWSRRLLRWGIASAVVAAALAVALLWLLLAGLEHMPAAHPLRLRNFVVFAVPGFLIYPICWHALVFRRRCYGTSDTWRLIATTYVACCAFDFAIFAAVSLFQGIVMLAQALTKSPSPTSFTFLLAPIGVAIFTLIFAALLAIPYVATAAPAAFLHRAALLACFAGERETA